MLKEITKIDLLKEVQECINKDKELRGHVKLDLIDLDTGADFNFLILSDKPFSWNIWDKVQEVVYSCLEKYDPYITLHFEWEYVSGN